MERVPGQTEQPSTARTARMSGIDGPGVAARVLGNAFNDRRRLDAGNDAQPAAALPAGFIGDIPVPDRCAAACGCANRQSCRLDLSPAGRRARPIQRSSRLHVPMAEIMLQAEMTTAGVRVVSRHAGLV
jgi:hypothetical protein